MELREYQKHAVSALWDYWKKNPVGHPIICAPTGSGKSAILSDVCKRILAAKSHYKIIVATHRKELIAQNAKHLYDLLGTPIGIYSAGLGQKTIRSVTCAGIQSIYKKDLPEIQLLIIDECHLLSPDQDSMYQKFIERLRNKNTNLKILGLSATPYRVDQGSLTDRNGVFTDICYDIGIKELIADNFLSSVISKENQNRIDFSDVKKSGYDYKQDDLENKMLPLVREHAEEITKSLQLRKRALVFCCGVEHAKQVCLELQNKGIRSDYVHAETLPMYREQILNRFKSGELQALCNVSILTTGYDDPSLDMIAVLRATKSTSLWVQIVGRGMRIAPNKKDCLVLDFGGNIDRHGSIDCIFIKQKGDKVEIGKIPQKTCPECGAVVAIATKKCPSCEYLFPISSCVEPKASTAAIISKPELLEVDSIEYKIHKKEGSPPMLRINYRCGAAWVMDFLCFEHGGYAAQMARRKWSMLGGNALYCTDTMNAFNHTGDLIKPAEIEVKREGKYYRVLRVTKERVEEEPHPLQEKYNF